MSAADGGEPAPQGPGGFARVADGYQRLWTPHRMAYIAGDDKPADGGEGEQCPFCRAPGLPDAQALVVARGELAYAVLSAHTWTRLRTASTTRATASATGTPLSCVPSR